MNTARCALSTLIILPNGHTVGTHPLVSRFIKGVFALRPPKPRYSEVWDVRIVLNYLRSLSPMKLLGLRDLTLKLCMLIALTSAQRCQTLHLLDIRNMQITKNKITFYVDKLLKQSRPGHHGLALEFTAYPPDRRLCVYRLITLYLERTKLLRKNAKETRFFISYRKPHRRVTKDTIARWLKAIMGKAGIDISKFKAHSVRAAATSTADARDVPVTEIMRTAGWSREKTFRQFYKKPILQESKFAKNILESVADKKK